MQKVTAGELAKVLGVSEKAVRQKALRKGWKYVEEPNPRGGKPIKYYLVEYLPDEIKKFVNNGTTEHSTEHANGTYKIIENKKKNQSNGTSTEQKSNGTTEQWNTTEQAQPQQPQGIEGEGFPIKEGLGNLLGNFEGDWETKKGSIGKLCENITSEKFSHKNGLIGKPDYTLLNIENEIWLTPLEVSELSGLSTQAIRKNCRNNKYSVKIEKGKGGNKGVTYQIALSSLPGEIQVKWINLNKDRAILLPLSITKKLHINAQLEIDRLKQKETEIDINNFANQKSRERLKRILDIIREALKYDREIHGTKRRYFEKLGKKYQVGRSTIEKYIKKYREGGIDAIAEIANIERKRGFLKWSEEAVEKLVGIYLKSIDKKGIGNIKEAYEKVVELSKKHNWFVGSLKSAYHIIENRMHPLLRIRATSGTKGVVSQFPIFRDTSDLMPMEILVGDQHVWDFWVVNHKTGEIYRPMCFIWEDMRTRMIVGANFSGSRKYNRWTVIGALRMAVENFGIYKKLYTDWGKPELSNTVRLINDELTQKTINKPIDNDFAEMFKREDGKYYLVDVDTGEVLDVVDTMKNHIRARVRNAKAKPIERLFNTLEKMMAQIGCPGKVLNPKAGIEEHEKEKARLKSIKDKLWTDIEFERVFFEEIMPAYNSRKHSYLGRSPLEELEIAKQQGWRMTQIPEQIFDFIFAERKIVTVQRGGRVRINNIIFKGKEIQKPEDIDNLVGLSHLVGKKIEVRFNPNDPTWALAIVPDGTRLLFPDKLGSMKDEELTRELNQERRRIAKAVNKRFRELTKGISGVIRYSKETPEIMKSLKEKEEYEKKIKEYYESDEYIQQEYEKALQRKKEYEEKLREKEEIVISVDFNPDANPQFMSRSEKFQFLYRKKLRGYKLTAEDEIFLAEFEDEKEDFAEGLKKKIEFEEGFLNGKEQAN